jgi:hypothetical protein
LPDEHNPLVGAVRVATPQALPQTPLTSSGAEPGALAPPLMPAQVHSQVLPLRLTVLALPAEHKPLAGALVAATPQAVPHAPLIRSGAEQEATVPPLRPVQLQS